MANQYNLDDAAALGKFNHFNWFQEITLLQGAPPTRGTGPDPLVGGNFPPLEPADNYLWYWDEVNSSNVFQDRSGAYIGTQTIFGSSGALALKFFDAPNLRLPGAVAEFTTYLVGVGSDPADGITFDGKAGFQGTAFKWKYTQTSFFDGDIILQNIDPARAGGGTIEFLGFLGPEDWDKERLNRLRAAGLTIGSELYGPTDPSPVAGADRNGTTLSGTPVVLDVLANDYDPDGTLDPATVTITTPPANGSFNVNPITGAVTYTPNPGFTGTDTFKYTVRDNDGVVSNEATVTIRVLQAPVAGDDSATTQGSSPVTIDVVANDSDSDGTIDPTSVVVVTSPSNGSVNVNPATGVITYTPNAGFTGTDAFDYTVKDADGLTSNEATVTVTVNPNLAPVAVDDQFTAFAGYSVILNVLANDSDPDGSLVPGTVTLTGLPSNGTATVNPATGEITYTPNAGFVGTDTFRYTVQDNSGAVSTEATVSMTVLQPTVRPNLFTANTLPGNDDESTDLVSIGFSVNFFGTNYSQLHVNNNGNVTFDGPLSTFTPFGLTAAIGTPIIAAFFADVDTRGAGSGLVTYGTGTVDGRPAFGVDYPAVGYYELQTNKLNTFQLILISREDTGAGNFDIEFNYNQIQWETGDASDGSNGLGGSSARVGYSNGTGDPGTFFELPGSGINGAFLDSNSATGLRNNSLGSPVLGRYLFQVRNGVVNQPPTAVNDEVTAFQGTPLAIPSSTLLSNDTDPEGATLSITGVSATSTEGGPVTFNPATGDVTYTPPAGFSGTDTFTYVVSDGIGTATGTVTVTVTAPPPTVTDVRVRFGSQSFSLMGNNRTLPWVNITAIDIVFSQDVEIDQNDLRLAGVSVSLYGGTFSYNAATRTATWTLAAPIGIDRLTLSLDGDDASSDGNAGVATADAVFIQGGDFSLGFNVLPGDYNGDGVVTIQDSVGVRNHSPGYGDYLI